MNEVHDIIVADMEETKMVICYDNLWKLLIDRKKKKTDLLREAKISSNALAHLSKGESVSVECIGKICMALDCTPNDILEFKKDLSEEYVG